MRAWNSTFYTSDGPTVNPTQKPRRSVRGNTFKRHIKRSQAVLGVLANVAPMDEIVKGVADGDPGYIVET